MVNSSLDETTVLSFHDLPEIHQELLRKSTAGPSVDLNTAAFLYGLTRSEEPRTMLEIGLATGTSATAHALGAQHSLVRFDIVDPLQTQDFNGRGLSQVRRALEPFTDKVVFHEKPSHMAMAQLLAAGMSYDYIFIDGDHRLDATLVDAFFANLLLKVGGRLVIDDRIWPMIGTVVEFLVTNYRHMTADLSHPRISVFHKTHEDQREWFDYWDFDVPKNAEMMDKIDKYRAASQSNT